MRDVLSLSFTKRFRFVICLSWLLIIFQTSSLQSKYPDTRYDGQPVLSPNGEKIAFVSDRDTSQDIWLMDSDGTNPINLTPDFDSSNELLPIWSPDNQHILFISDQSGKTDIWSFSLDESKLRNLTQNIKNSLGHPQWSPDGKRIAFVMFEESENTSIWIMENDGKNLTKIVSGVNYVFPSWSLDGKSLSYSSYSINKTELLLIQLETGDIRTLSTKSMSGYAWSPKGNLIIFTTLTSTNPLVSDIWLVQTDVAYEVQITTSIYIPYASEPVWSPDGTKVLFRSYCGKNTDIWSLTLSTKVFVNLTSCKSGNNSFANWFPDNEHILLQSDRSGKNSVWVIGVDKDNPMDLTNSN